jgi:hypothetical protein
MLESHLRSISKFLPILNTALSLIAIGISCYAINSLPNREAISTNSLVVRPYQQNDGKGMQLSVIDDLAMLTVEPPRRKLGSQGTRLDIVARDNGVSLWFFDSAYKQRLVIGIQNDEPVIGVLDENGKIFRPVLFGSPQQVAERSN